jgi:hypothetical protein
MVGPDTFVFTEERISGLVWARSIRADYLVLPQSVHRLKRGIMIDLSKLKQGDKVLVECEVQHVFVNGGMVQVATRDTEDGFDAYVDEIKDVISDKHQ